MLIPKVAAHGATFPAATCVCVVRFALLSVQFTAMMDGFQRRYRIVPWCVVVVPLHALGVVLLTCLQVAAVGSTFPAATCVCVPQFALLSVIFTSVMYGF